MNKQIITTILVIAGIVALYFILTSFTKSNSNTVPFAGSLVDAQLKLGYTNVHYSIDQYSTQQHYFLTFTPTDVVLKSLTPTPLPITKEITVESYRAFIKKYPDGLAEGNVLSQYN